MQLICNIFISEKYSLSSVEMDIPEDYDGLVFKRYKYGSLKRAEEQGLRTSLHLFPKEKKLRKTWAIKCRIGGKIPDYFAVCNHHFKEIDFCSGLFFLINYKKY